MNTNTDLTKKRLSISNLKTTFISKIARNHLMKQKSSQNNNKKERILKTSTLFYKAREKGDKDQTGVYVGEWKQGDMHGYGRIIKQNFSIYEGFFKKGQRDGVGIELLPTQELFIGQFKDDYKNGLGIYFFKQGGFFCGFFKDGQRDGFGVLVEQSGKEIYRGFWEDDVKHGRGVEFFAKGSKYDGFFNQGKRDGIGLMEYSKSLTYIGEWKENNRHGLGKFQGLEKEVEGVFFENELMQLKTVNPSKFYDQLMKDEVPCDIEAYLKKVKYKIKKKRRKSSQDLETLLKNSLPQLACQLVLHKERKLYIYLLVKFIFGRRTSLDAQIKKMFFYLTHKVEINNPLQLWEPKFHEFFNLKTSYPWGFYILDKKSKNENLELVKSKQWIDFLMTNEIVQGKTGDTISIEGANSKQGVNISFYCSLKGNLNIEKMLFICPLFIISTDIQKEQINRSIALSEKLNIKKSKSKFYKKNI
jgi:hypothetical protein